MKKIIILDKDPSETVTLRFLLWLVVPTTRWSAYANLNAVSEYPEATALELVDLKDGKVLEQIMTQEWPPGTGQDQIKSDLITLHSEAQAILDGKNPRKLYGTSWDGLIWTDTGTT